MTPLPLHYFETRRGFVTAVQVTATNLPELADWTGGTLHHHSRRWDDSIDVPAVSGFHARVGDWIVRYPEGRFERMSDDTFNDRYQRS